MYIYKDAQLAVINTFKGNSSAPRLEMEDHVTGKEILAMFYPFSQFCEIDVSLQSL